MATSDNALLGRFGRAFALLLNRTLMYDPRHPYIKQSVAEFLAVAAPLLQTISPLVFILNRGQFYIDEEILDPRINVSRTAAIFKSSGLQSISFETGLQEYELMIFAELFVSLSKASSADTIKEEMVRRGVFNIKVNHVMFKKVTEHDQVVSRDALKNVTPFMDSDDQQQRKKFMETLMESVLTEELASTLNIKNLMANPQAFTQKMIEADLAVGWHSAQGSQAGSSVYLAGETEPPINASVAADGTSVVLDASPVSLNPTAVESENPSFAADPAGNASGPSSLSDYPEDGSDIVTDQNPDRFEGDSEVPPNAPDGGKEKASAHYEAGAVAAGPSGMPGTAPGVLLLQQIEVMHQEVEKHLEGQGEVSLSDLTHSIFEMKKQLLENLQAQKALGIAYANESAIVAAADKLTDKVLIELIKEEYKSGAVAPQRMAHLIVRLIPEAKDLKRLLPQIKRALLQQGMSPSEYFTLIQVLREELQGEELTRILQESSEAVGLDGDMLIEEVKRNPAQAAELIYLASEIRKGGADENALSDILVEYVERLGNQMAKSVGESFEGTDHLKQVITDVESTLLKKLGGMNVNEDLLKRMEERLNSRMESILDNMRVQWLHHQPGSGVQEKPVSQSVLQTLEQNVGHDEELGPIFKALRVKVDAGEIEENNFIQIHEEIIRLKQLQKVKYDDQDIAEGVLTPEEVMFILDKEIARAKRYGTTFSALAFAFVKAKPEKASLQEIVTSEAILEAALKRLSDAFRTADYVGRIGKNKILALLPMAFPDETKKALTRVMRLLHATPLNVRGVCVHLRVAGVSADFDAENTLNAQMFVKHLSQQLTDMVVRIKNIQMLF